MKASRITCFFQVPNYVTVSAESLGEPEGFSPALLNLLWALSGRAVPEALVGGCIMVSDDNERTPGRIGSWCHLATDVLYLYAGKRSLADVTVVINEELNSHAPPAAVSRLPDQVTALEAMTPGWLPVESEAFVTGLKEKERAAAERRKQKE